MFVDVNWLCTELVVVVGVRVGAWISPVFVDAVSTVVVIVRVMGNKPSLVELVATVVLELVVAIVLKTAVVVAAALETAVMVALVEAVLEDLVVVGDGVAQDDMQSP